MEDRCYSMQELVALCILGYKKYQSKNKKNDKEKLTNIIKNVLELAEKKIEIEDITSFNTDLLKEINFKWKMTAEEVLAYSTCVFYVLTKRDEEITEENIVKEFLSELYTHHPRRIRLEADFILGNFLQKLI